MAPAGVISGTVPIGERRYSGAALYADEVWPNVSERNLWVGYLNESYYPGGQVSWCVADGSALPLSDPKLNEPAFLEAVARRYNVPLDTAVVLQTTSRPARARIGWPDPDAPPEPDLFCKASAARRRERPHEASAVERAGLKM